jgi:ferritin
MLNQFLYGEMTGIQVGHWLYDAPDVQAAKFLARQSLEEMQHVDNFLRIMTMIGVRRPSRRTGRCGSCRPA